MRHLFSAKFLLVWLALLCFVAGRLLREFPHFCRHWYSGRFYPLVARALSKFSDWFSLSLDNVLVVALALLLVLSIVLVAAGKLKPARFAVGLLNLAAALYIGFYVLWGFNYSSGNRYEVLGLKADSVSATDYERIAEKLARLAGDEPVQVDELSRSRVDSLVEQAFRQQARSLGLPDLRRQIQPKTMLADSLLARASVFGYFGVFASEVHVSRRCQPADYPLLLAHERMHRLGITGEGEANFFAWLVCHRSPSAELRYCSRVFLLRHLLAAGYGQTLVAAFQPEKKDSLPETRWMNHFTDRFLKWNAVSEGISDYGRVIEPAARYLLQVEGWNGDEKKAFQPRKSKKTGATRRPARTR